MAIAPCFCGTGAPGIGPPSGAEGRVITSVLAVGGSRSAEAYVTVALIGTRDTKAAELAWVRERLEFDGCQVITIDPGTHSPEQGADFGPRELARQGGSSIEALRSAGDRGHAIAVLADGVRSVVSELAARGEIQGVLAVGGSGGSALAAPALQALPIGFPKVLVSTMASGNIRPYVGASDVTVTYSVVDIAGLNSVSEAVLGNASAAIGAMARAFLHRRSTPATSLVRPLVTMTMFGVTTPAADEARERLEQLGYEVVVFHATGSGGSAMEKLIASDMVAGVCDITTTELCDELAGGILSAGPNRLEAAARHGVPQVVSVGALDMVNFGPIESVPAHYSDRLLLQHNPSITLMRTTDSEAAELGRQLAQKVARSTGPAAVFLPGGGVSAVDVPGQPFFDPVADKALFDAIKEGLSDTDVEVHEVSQTINDPGFGRLMADRLHAMIEGRNSS